MLIGTVVEALPTARLEQGLEGLQFVKVTTDGRRIAAADLVGAQPGDTVLLSTARHCTAPVDVAVVAVVRP